MAAVVHALFPPSATAISPIAGAEDDGSFAEVMREVGAALEADALVVAWRHHDEGRPVLLFTDGEDAGGLVAERALNDLAGLHDTALDTAYRAQWRLADNDAGGGDLTASIATGAGVVTITGRFNRLGAATRARARDAATRLLPIVRPFVRLWAARLAMASRMRALTAAVNKSDVGILLVNGQGQLLFANAAAEALMAQNDGIRRQGRLLSGGRLADTLRLQATIQHVIASSGREKRAPVVALTRETRRPLLAAVMAAETTEDQAEEGTAIIYLCDPDQDLTGLVEPACKLYGLSPVETRLACILAQGVSLAGAADAMRVREQTARSYLKQIFLKTDTNRQAELVWLMLKSSVRTTSFPRPA